MILDIQWCSTGNKMILQIYISEQLFTVGISALTYILHIGIKKFQLVIDNSNSLSLD